jgi:hypothetical protein
MTQFDEEQLDVIVALLSQLVRRRDESGTGTGTDTWKDPGGGSG